MIKLFTWMDSLPLALWILVLCTLVIWLLWLTIVLIDMRIKHYATEIDKKYTDVISQIMDLEDDLTRMSSRFSILEKQINETHYD
ncbi:MAG: hypothetical protein DRJ15_10125 [Bacteroidetes bacterium]|nr:MAG: hypothetical protein DRJ15_10125 [Bacteroidota bacterium]